MKHLFVFLLILTLAITACQSQQTEPKPTITETLDHLTLAVNSRDYNAISNYLSDDYQYEGMARPMSVAVLKQVIQQFPKIESLIVRNTKVREDKIIVDVIIQSVKNTTEKQIILDKNHKIIQADIAALSLNGHGKSSEKETKKVVEDKVYTMPFTLSVTQMVVEATINGKKGNFVVDSGTPMALMLNSKFQNYKGAKAKKVPMDVSGMMNSTMDVTIKTFEWNELQFTDVKAISTDLDDLGRRLKVKNFAGTIGYALLKNYIVDFDYTNNQLKLWTNSESMKKFYNITSDKTVPFTMAHHMPVIKAKIGNLDLRFGLDSGCQTSMIDPRWKTDLKANYTIIGAANLNGASTKQREVVKVSMKNFKLNNSSYTMKFLIAELYGGEEEVTAMDGLIGNEFLSYRKTVVNYLDNELYIID